MARTVHYFMALMVGSILNIIPAVAQTAEVKLITAKAVGEQLTITVNNIYKGITIDWGDGDTVKYSTSDDVLLEVTGEVKGDTVTVYGDEKQWNTLMCPDCGLTGIVLSNAKQLQSLYVQDNQLTRLDLRGMTKLTDLDCARNQISKLQYTSNVYPERDLTNIENLNLSGNALSGTFVVRTATLQNLNISDNSYTAVTTTNNTDLRSLICGNNSLSSLAVSKCDSISTVVCHNNKISKLTLPTDVSTLQQFICDSNNISNSFDFSTCSLLSDLSIAYNNISDLTMPENKKYNSLNFTGNKLTLAVLPKPSYKPDYIKFTPQDTVSISGYENVKTNENGSYVDVVKWTQRKTNMLDLSSLVMLAVTENYKGYNGATIDWYYLDSDGQEHLMEAGKNSTLCNDYYKSANKFTFFAEHPKAFARITATSGSYANDTIYIDTNIIAIGENAVVGIDNITTDDSNNGITVTIGKNTIAITSTQDTVASIYATDGTLIWNGNVGNASTTITVPAGIYIVNGKKYYVK